MGIFSKNTDQIPELPRGLTTAYCLAGKHPEYEGPNKLRTGPDYLHGCLVIRRWAVSETDIATARDLLMSPKTYGDRGLGARCYFPGFAFTFGQNQSAIDALVCLECRWVVFHLGEQSVAFAPTDDGLARLRKIYETVIQKGQIEKT
ncbi:MAG: hypothetical protein AB1705_25640 [Verrucomicrobiota bacterium]